MYSNRAISFNLVGKRVTNEKKSGRGDWRSMKTIRRISLVSIGMFLFLMFSLGLGLNLAKAGGYSDISESNAEFPYIKYLYEKGIISGYSDGEFHPNEGLTRAQAAVVMVKAAGLQIDPTSESPFNDVSQEHWAKDYIAASAKAGYLQGLPDGSYHPEDQLSRAQGISLILRLSQQDQSKAVLPQLTDVDSAHWASQAIAVGLAADMVGVSADGTQFLPDADFTRLNLAHALGTLLTGDPELYATTLEGTLKVKKGIIKIKTAGSENETQINTETTVKAGDIITSGAASSAELNYPDGSSLLIEENTRITIAASEGRKYIKTDGSEGIAVDWLNIKIKQGTMIGGLATRHESSQKTGVIPKLKSGLTASLQGIGLIAAEDEDMPWYAASEEKKVKVQVDMPWGVAAIRGTFWMNAVAANGASTTSCLTGSVAVTNGGQTVSLSGNQSTQVTQASAPPPAAATMPPAAVQQFAQAQDWIEQTAEIMDQVQEAAPTAPPAAVEQPTMTTPATTAPVTTTPVTTTTSTVQTVTQAMNSSGVSSASSTPTPSGSTSSGGGGGGGSSATIKTIEDINAAITVGQSYTLPTTVTANMSNGKTAQKPVVWNNTSPDLSQVGTVTITGTVSGYSGTVTVTLTITSTPVVTIQSIDNISANITVGSGYSLPTTVTAKMSDGSTTEQAVLWNNAIPDLSHIGTVIITGTVSGYSGTVTLTLIISNIPVVTIQSIDNISTTITVGDSYSLPTTVTAKMSDGSTTEQAVVWSNTSPDLSHTGTIAITGTVSGYSGTVSLSIIIKEKATIQSIDPISNTITVGDSYSLPTTVTAKMSDGSTTEQAVVWSNTSPDLSHAGTIAITGTVSGYSGTVSLSIIVKEKADKTPPSNLSIMAGTKTAVSIELILSAEDSSGIKNYEIYRDNTKIATVTEAKYTDTNLESGKEYSYQFKATDIYDNQSELSSALLIRALAAGVNGTWSVTPVTAFSSDFGVTVTGLTDANYFAIYKNGSIIGSVTAITGKVRSLPAMFSDPALLTVKIFSDAAGTTVVKTAACATDGTLTF